MKKILPVLAFVLVLGVGIGGYLWWNGTDATSDVVYGSQSDSTVLASETSLVTWPTTFFKTQVPGNLRLRTNTENPRSPILGSYFWDDIASRQADQLAVTVGNLNDSSLAETSAAKLRLDDSTDYAAVSRSYAPSGALGFSKDTDGNYETTLLWQNANRYVVVVVSGSATRKPELDQALENVVANWQWQ